MSCGRQIMATRQEGLTKTYNRFHDRAEGVGGHVWLRGLHRGAESGQALTVGAIWVGHGSTPPKQGEALR